MVDLGVRPFAVSTESLFVRNIEVVMKFGFGGRSETGNKHQRDVLGGKAL